MGISSLNFHEIPVIRMSDYLKNKEDYKLDERMMLIATDDTWKKLEEKLQKSFGARYEIKEEINAIS